MTKPEDMISYTSKIIAKPFSLITCENNHAMYLTKKTLYQVHEDSFAYPGLYFKNKLFDLNDGNDIYTCKICKRSCFIIDREGIAVYIRGRKTIIWPIFSDSSDRAKFDVATGMLLWQAVTKK